jgi:hypothetical protein
VLSFCHLAPRMPQTSSTHALLPSSQLLTGATSFLIVGLRDTISAPLASLALLYTVSLSGLFQFTTRLFVEVRILWAAHCVSVLHSAGEPSQG